MNGPGRPEVSVGWFVDGTAREPHGGAATPPATRPPLRSWACSGHSQQGRRADAASCFAADVRVARGGDRTRPATFVSGRMRVSAALGEAAAKSWPEPLVCVVAGADCVLEGAFVDHAGGTRSA